LIPTERRRHTYFVAGCCFDPVLRGLGKFEASCLFAYLIQFTPREPHPLAGVGAAAIPEFSSSVSAIAAATCVRKNGWFERPKSLRRGLRAEQLFTAICANLKGCLLFLGNLLRRVL